MYYVFLAEKSECQTIISLKYLFLSQTEVTLGNCDTAVVK